MRWVEGNHGKDTTPFDPIASLGLHYLHGLDITESLIKADKLTQHGLESRRAYQATPADIESFFTYWCEQGALFDVDAEAGTLGSRMIESGLLDPNVVFKSSPRSRGWAERPASTLRGAHLPQVAALESSRPPAPSPRRRS